MDGEISKPHDHLFRSVFRDEAEAAALLRAHLAEPVAGAVRWSSLARQDVTFIDDRLRDSESDLLFAVRRKTDGAPAWLYVLLEHQSKPDPLLRLLKYSVRIWERDRRRHPNDKLLRPNVPLVWYQGRYRWREPAEFSALFAEPVRAWPGVPRYAHLLIDQTGVAPEQLRGDLHGRSAQHALLAAYRKSWPILQRLVPLLAELGRAGRDEDVRQIVHCDHDAGGEALAAIRGRGTAAGAGR